MKPSVVSWDRAREAKKKFEEEFKFFDWLVGIGLNPLHPDGYFLDAYVLKIKENLPDTYDGVPIRQTIVPDLSSFRPNHWKNMPPMKWEKITQKLTDGRDYIIYKGPWGSVISYSNDPGDYYVSCHALGFTSLPMFGEEGRMGLSTPEEALFAEADHIIRENVRSRAQAFCNGDPWARIAELEAEVKFLRHWENSP